mmetsp:Transcript_195/g.564  ORF Transcript_195/g.564 Transcript_195/m.564 type:complete len:81 (+) Transcript_195:43-285(+)|eukprot:CAMPEP_0196794990 /NCGR_PEP_ID=MMETSP1104-20130614/35300_1 /TAXON_ID=33652 /ORGANISM="Cafeteria sp., Strain Caron Lab Isolate" /LENGTH=80 /DNA_ID=CAMNT_0042165379 /DNA_START=49 /DNA_END=291 /DNA_ORIENTATION=-
MSEAPDWKNRKASEIQLSNRGMGDLKTTALYMAPLAFGCALPLIRIGLRHNPVLRDRLFYGTIGVALVHGVYMIKQTYPE